MKILKYFCKFIPFVVDSFAELSFPVIASCCFPSSSGCFVAWVVASSFDWLIALVASFDWSVVTSLNLVGSSSWSYWIALVET